MSSQDPNPYIIAPSLSLILWKVPNLFDKMHNFIMQIMINMLFMLIM